MPTGSKGMGYEHFMIVNTNTAGIPQWNLYQFWHSTPLFLSPSPNAENYNLKSTLPRSWGIKEVFKFNLHTHLYSYSYSDWSFAFFYYLYIHAFCPFFD